MTAKRLLPLLAVAVLLSSTLSAPAQRSRNASDPQTIYNNAINEKAWKWGYTGEDFAWQTNASGLHSLVQGYERTKDTAYLDYAVKYFDALLAKMETGPDGYKGFIGPYEYNTGKEVKYWCDDHIGDALLFNAMLEFSTTVTADANLKQKYGEKALQYANEAKKNFFEKWDARGTYKQDGPFGFYVGWDHYGKPGQFKDWKVVNDDPDCSSQNNLSLPFNKDIDCGALAIRIWLATGDESYKHRGEQLFGYMKSRMQNYNGAYHWNYWEPTGQYDLATTPEDLKKGSVNEGSGPEAAKTSMRHWTAVHPHRNYQSFELGNIVFAYNAGVVFTEADIKGMLQTNLKVMWNGDKDKPLWANSNIDLLKKVGEADLYHVAGAPEKPGEAWTPLAQFDATYRTFSRRRGGNDNATPPSFDRRLAKGSVQIPEVYAQFPLGNVRTVQMACVLPSIFKLGDTTAIDCKLIESGELEVAIYSADGKSKVATLKKWNALGGTDGREGVNYILFDGKLPDGKQLEPGNYRVRWTVTNDGYREFPIKVLPAK
jgi:hypothetical protein